MSIKIPQRFFDEAARILKEHKAQYLGVYTMFGGGGTQTSTQSTDPWSGQQPYLTGTNNPNLAPDSTPPSTFNSAAQLYANPSDYPQLYPGSTSGSQVAPFNPQETSSLNSLYDTGMSGNSAMSSATNALTNFNNGTYASAGNPYFSNMANEVASTVTPQIESQFTQGNSMNNPAAAFATGQGMGSAIGGLDYQNYSQQMQNMLQSASTGSTLNQSQNIADITNALGAGQTSQNQAQNTLTSDVNAFNYNQTLPFQMLDQYANLVNGQYGSASSLTQPTSNNTLSNVIGAGSGLAGTALMLSML